MNNQQIDYTLPSGKTAIITVYAEKNWDGTLFADVKAAVSGVYGLPESGLCVPAGLPAWAVSAIGRLPLTAEINAQVLAAMDSITAEVAGHNVKALAHLADLEAIDAGAKKIEALMAL